MAPVQGRPPTGAHRLIAGHSQYPQDVCSSLLDRAADLLEQHRFRRHQLSRCSRSICSTVTSSSA